ncbi:hypothetical protein ACN47E_000977 [Coniothyrium glycines]
MWLLAVETLDLHEFLGTNIPAYGILSHTWNSGEISFAEMKDPERRKSAQRKPGFNKIAGCRAQAEKDGLAYIWIDSCCIDKSSSAELSEAINSMFHWYKQAARCYVFLADVSSGEANLAALSKSLWFTRGWTLQELLAPEILWFYANDWTVLGLKTTVYAQENNGALCHIDSDPEFALHRDLAKDISTITDIPLEYLNGKKAISQACLAQRMYWAAQRMTTRPEDRAYSLMGIFDINMPILYGEGLEKAFTRLQREIISRSPDQSIFAWYEARKSSHRLLADSPGCFRNSGKITQMNRHRSLRLDTWTNWSSFSMSNLGLEITLPLSTTKSGGQLQWGDSAKAALHCAIEEPGKASQRIFLDLIFLNSDISGKSIFMCHRARKWITGLHPGYPTSVFLSSNDYISALSAQKIVKQPQPDMPSSIVSRFMGILADEMDMDVCELNDELTFADLGVDSLMMLTIEARIREDLDFDIGNDAFLEHYTIGAFRRFLTSR